MKRFMKSMLIPIWLAILPIMLILLIIQIAVNTHRRKLRADDYYRHHWFLDLGLIETAELMVEDHKRPIKWFEQSDGDKDYMNDWIDN